MPGPWKVRVFQDKQKSPNWYVEWRDEAGKRHCESCGPNREAAERRAEEVRKELDNLRRRRTPPASGRPTDSAEPASAGSRTQVVELEIREAGAAGPLGVLTIHVEPLLALVRRHRQN